MKKKFVKFALLFWSIIVLLLTTIPMKEYNGTVETYYDKVAHFFLFGIFSFLLYLLLREIMKKEKLFFVSIFGATLYSLLIEFLQVYIPGRNASELDLLAGFLGAVCFSAMSLIVFKNKKDE